MPRVPILLYHWFTEPGAAVGASPEFGIAPGEFRRQMVWLRDHGFTAVTVAELVAAIRGAQPLPPRPVGITFDDAYADFNAHALPVLVELGLKATLFVVADRVGRTNDWDRKRGEPERALMTWEHLRAAAAAGTEIGSHSRTHPDLRTVDDARLAGECRDSRRILEDGLGRPVDFFAYPHGLYDERVKRAVQVAGYAGACAVLLRFRDMLRSDSFALMRAIIHADKGLGNFRLRVGLARPFHRLAPPIAAAAP